MTITTDAVVIGAGVVGLAVARALSAGGMETVVLERNAGIGEETSSRNSEVVHAGIYYPPGSLKAVTCVQGRSLLYAHAESHGVAHRRCGKRSTCGATCSRRERPFPRRPEEFTSCLTVRRPTERCRSERGRQEQ